MDVFGMPLQMLKKVFLSWEKSLRKLFQTYPFDAWNQKHKEYLRIAMVSVMLMVGSGGAAAYAIDDSDDCENTRIENGEMPPFLANVGQNSALAGLAIVA